MEKIIMSPSKYIQGEGVLSNISKYVYPLGNFPMIIADDFIMRITKSIVENSFNDNKLTFEKFNGECSKKEINRIKNSCKNNNCDIVIGIGGGKTLDTAKAVAYYHHCPVVIVPTIASTDAPCSSLSVIYTEEGAFEEYLILPQNPNIVLMDSDIISKAPVRLLIAGMGDALATFFEARACRKANAILTTGAHPTDTAYALATLCYETLLKDGYKAKLAVENKTVTKAVENIIEANTYLSGIGFESGGLAAAHAIHNGFTVLEECHHLYHGEKVAFGTIVQLVLENSSEEEINTVIEFCNRLSLPITLEDMGIKEINEKDIMKVAKASCATGETMENMPFKIYPKDVYAAIITTDALGRMSKYK